jgi:hypothetical protein
LDGITILSFLVLISCFVLGIGCSLLAAWLTRQLERGRGCVVLGAFFLPAIYVAYLLTAGYLRNDFHYSHLEASNRDGECTLPLANGLNLIFFDETPSASSVGKGDWQNTGVPILNNIQHVAITDRFLFGQTSISAHADGPVDFFFALDLTSGQVEKFANESSFCEHAIRNWIASCCLRMLSGQQRIEPVASFSGLRLQGYRLFSSQVLLFGSFEGKSYGF